MIHLFYTRTKIKFEPKFFDSFLKQLPSTIQTEILKFRKWEDRQRGLLGKILLIEGIKLLGHDTGLLNNMKFILVRSVIITWYILSIVFTNFLNL